MRVLVNWLREMCPVELAPEELADLLTSKGLEVESIERPWEGLEGVVVARVVEVGDHPGSDRLCVARVDTGAGEQEVVVGVRNMGPGDLVPYAGVGARVPALPDPLGAKPVRGVTSHGMLCSPSELGVSADHGAILILPPDAGVGADVKATFGLDDAVLDIEVAPNRGDLLSVLGVAREVAAATGTPLEPPQVMLEEAGRKADEAATLRVEDLERCPRYLAKVIGGVSVGPSPILVQARLNASGMRPLSNVVDATNYVMLELGQPMHPFDLHRVAGPGIVVRRASEGERLVTLDDVERMLTPEDLVIADVERAVAIAGVMGSAQAEVAPETVDVLLESAHFGTIGVLRTARRLGLRTEASIRFSRGADPEAVGPAAHRAASLMATWSGGQVLAGALDVGSVPDRRHLIVRPARATLILGHEITAPDAREALGRLRISATARGDHAIDVEVPGFRPDLQREEDLVEEIARVRGYEEIGAALPPVRQAGGLQDSYAFRMRVRRALSRAGLRETTSYSFASATDLELTDDRDAVRLANPLSADEEFLRTSLVPGLLRAVSRNATRGVRSVALFEVGRVFFPREAQPPEIPVEEHDRAGFVLWGPAALGYPGDRREMDVFDAKGVMEALMESLGIGGWTLGPPPSGPFHPTRSASIAVGDELAGEVGELHPRLAAQLDLPGRVALAELEMSVLAEHATTDVQVGELPRFPPVHRDLSFLVDQAVPAGAVLGAIGASGEDLDVTAVLIDVFTGDPVPTGRKSLTFSVDLRAPDRTLTDQDASRAVEAIAARIALEFGGELRTA